MGSWLEEYQNRMKQAVVGATSAVNAGKNDSTDKGNAGQQQAQRVSNANNGGIPQGVSVQPRFGAATASSGLANNAINAGGNYAATQNPVAQVNGTVTQQITTTPPQGKNGTANVNAIATNPNPPMPSKFNPDGSEKPYTQYQEEINNWYQNGLVSTPDYQAPESKRTVTLQDILNMSKPSETDLKEQKKARQRALIAGIGDGLTSLADIIGTINGGTALKTAPGLSAVAMKRYEDLLKKQEEDRKTAQELAWKMYEAEGNEDAREQNAALERWKLKYNANKDKNDQLSKTAEALGRQNDADRDQKNKDRAFKENQRQFDEGLKFQKRDAAAKNSIARTNARTAERRTLDTETTTISEGKDMNGNGQTTTRVVHVKPNPRANSSLNGMGINGTSGKGK